MDNGTARAKYRCDKHLAKLGLLPGKGVALPWDAFRGLVNRLDSQLKSREIEQG